MAGNFVTSKWLFTPKPNFIWKIRFRGPWKIILAVCSAASPAISQNLWVLAGRGGKGRDRRGGRFHSIFSRILRLSLSAKLWSILNHSDKKWKYFLIERLVQLSAEMNASHPHGAFQLKIPKYSTTIHSLPLAPLYQVVNTLIGALYLLWKLIHLESGQGRGRLCHCRAIPHSSF